MKKKKVKRRERVESIKINNQNKPNQICNDKIDKGWGVSRLIECCFFCVRERER